jgi:hypothetical protein
MVPETLFINIVLFYWWLSKRIIVIGFLIKLNLLITTGFKVLVHDIHVHFSQRCTRRTKERLG